ncbi:MAG: RIP metalloprotease RseP [Crocinitomicaceae bacterium]|nr:RIP metalloprotease RseP [Crocinitomicaceae bacterium]
MEILVKATQFILSLSLLIALHELGHYATAKWFKIRVEKFYLFFNPWFSLWKKKIGETEWGIGWLPLGGYVKISGMIDESMDKEQMKKPPQPWEFRSKPAWQRLIVMLGGVTVNLLLGYFIFMMILFVWGNERLEPQKMPFGIYADELGQEYGLKTGDKLVSLNGEKLNSFKDFRSGILLDNKTELIVERNGQEVSISLPEDIEYQMIKKDGANALFTMPIPFIVDDYPEDIQFKNAQEAGILPGDSIVGVNNQATPYFQDFSLALKDKAGEKISVKYYREGKLDSVTVEVAEDKRGDETVGVIGIKPVDDITRWYEIEEDHYGFFASIPAGFAYGNKVLSGYVKQMKFLFTSKGVSQLGGFGSIANMFGEIWVWENFWRMTALLSIILAFMNILPIPALDGGHVVFLLYEMITGRAPHQKVLEYAQIVGFVILFSLILYANGNDIYRYFFK